MKHRTIIFNKNFFYFIFAICSNILKKIFKLVSMKNSNLKLCAVRFTKDTHQIPKYQISAVEFLRKK